MNENENRKAAVNLYRAVCKTQLALESHMDETIHDGLSIEMVNLLQDLNRAASGLIKGDQILPLIPA